MDQVVRNRLRNVVTQCRKALEGATAEDLQGRFGIFTAAKKGEVHIEDESRMAHLPDDDRACRQDLIEHLNHIEALGYKSVDALDQLVREIAFTHLNRLCAYKMMEARSLIREAVSRGLKSQGFLFYLADHPEEEKLHKSGQQDVAYRHFLDWLGGTLSDEIGVLFNPNDPANRIYPPHRVLDEVLTLINGDDLAGTWTADETIGWVYQYFTPRELRDKARKASSAPRNSYELAFRNQFFTPRYVVEFLADNTLGRTWYEMRQGDTLLKDRCKYLVRRSSEVFLQEGVEPPSPSDDLKDRRQERRFYVCHRHKKDPREIRVLDPACGSGHFLIYCFDLLQLIYEEAYEDPELRDTLRQDYPVPADFRQAVPELILKHNLHGIDIDLRATQIAALALWLRCQRAFQTLDLTRDERPTVRRSNIVCAEPMPGEPDLRAEFAASLQPRILGQLVEVVFEKMKLAGEAGSLLKIEEELKDVTRRAKAEYVEWKKHEENAKGQLFPELAVRERGSLFDFADLTDEAFLDRAEEEITSVLSTYAETTANGKVFRRKLFADDAAHGFAFLDLCHKTYDVVLMNPPFGEPSKLSRSYLYQALPSSSQDILSAFIERWVPLLGPRGFLGAITSRLIIVKDLLEQWRADYLLGSHAHIDLFGDLGYGVLDEAVVEAAAYTLQRSENTREQPSLFFSVLDRVDKDSSFLSLISRFSRGEHQDRCFPHHLAVFNTLPRKRIAYWCSEGWLERFSSLSRAADYGIVARKGLETGRDFELLRLFWEVAPDTLTPMRRWTPYSKGGEYRPLQADVHLVFDWSRQDDARRTSNSELYGSSGVTYTERTTSNFAARVLPTKSLFSPAGPGIFDEESETPWGLLGWLSSSVVSYYLELLVGGGDSSAAGTAARHFSPSLVEMLPVPKSFRDLMKNIGSRAKEIHDLLLPFRTEETSWMYKGYRRRDGSLREVCDAGFSAYEKAVIESLRLFSELDEAVFSAYELTEAELKDVAVCLGRPYPVAGDVPREHYDLISSSFTDGPNRVEEQSADDEGIQSRALKKLCYIADPRFESLSVRVGASPKAVADVRIQLGLSPQDGTRQEAEEVFSYSVGASLGRWDVRIGLGKSRLRSVEAFQEMPKCPPAMLQNDDGHPAGPEDLPSGYPIQIDWDGILVDDPEHEDDIVRRVQDVLEVIWKGRSEAIEKEGCQVLGVKKLRDYFRKSGNGGFWVDHLKRYSKSRRKAPIYWYLRSDKGNYGLWLYYHRLDKDILFKALLNYVEPKIRLEEDRLHTLRARKQEAGSSGREAKHLEDQIDREEQFVSELYDFKDKLRRAADLRIMPDLNDGVVLNIAPLWELVPWKEPRQYWEALRDGKYDWSNIAYQLWPERVGALCRKDRSVAIAHGKEDLWEGKAKEVAPKKRVMK